MRPEFRLQLKPNVLTMGLLQTIRSTPRTDFGSQADAQVDCDEDYASIRNKVGTIVDVGNGVSDKAARGHVVGEWSTITCVETTAMN